MATLSGSTLTNCFFIPDFIGSGTITAFAESTNAPTSWTKDTTHNNKSLRIINGNIANGGILNFTSVLTNTSWSGGTSPNPAAMSASTSDVAPEIRLSATSYTISSASGALADSPPHQHSYTGNGFAARTPGPAGSVGGPSSTSSGSEGGGGQHTHTAAPYPSTAHQHGTGLDSLGNPHSHPISESAHSHPVSFSVDFSVSYRDVIFAVKD
jgi:hypothetical protein